MLRKEDAVKVEIKYRPYRGKQMSRKVYTFCCRHCGVEIQIDSGDLKKHSGACKLCVAVDRRKTAKDYDDSVLPEGAVRVERQFRSSGGYRKVVVYRCSYPGCEEEVKFREDQQRDAKLCRSHCRVKGSLDLPGSVGTDIVERTVSTTGRVIKFLYYLIPCRECGSIRRVARSKVKEDNGICRDCSSRIRPYEALYNTLCSHKRNIELGIDLTYEEFLEFTKTTSCEYCGDVVKWVKYSRKKNGTRYNLDRKDNNLGYTKSNLAVCCKICNRIKREAFTYEETKAGMLEVVIIRKRESIFTDNPPVKRPLDLEEKLRIGRGSNKRLRPYEALYRQFDRTQTVSGKVQSLTYEDFVEFTGIHNCEYCGKDIFWAKYSPRAVGYNLDRKNNDKGYEQGNIAVCCGWCNGLKSSHLTYEEFKVFMRAVIKIRNQEAPILGPQLFVEIIDAGE